MLSDKGGPVGLAHVRLAHVGLGRETLMQRVTVTLDEELMADLDHMIAARGYQNRSEAIRDLARAGIREAVQETG